MSLRVTSSQHQQAEALRAVLAETGMVKELIQLIQDYVFHCLAQVALGKELVGTKHNWKISGNDDAWTNMPCLFLDILKFANWAQRGDFLYVFEQTALSVNSYRFLESKWALQATLSVNPNFYRGYTVKLSVDRTNRFLFFYVANEDESEVKTYELATATLTTLANATNDGGVRFVDILSDDRRVVVFRDTILTYKQDGIVEKRTVPGRINFQWQDARFEAEYVHAQTTENHLVASLKQKNAKTQQVQIFSNPGLLPVSIIWSLCPYHCLTDFYCPKIAITADGLLAFNYHHGDFNTDYLALATLDDAPEFVLTLRYPCTQPVNSSLQFSGTTFYSGNYRYTLSFGVDKSQG